jgi:hypothetical protein
MGLSTKGWKGLFFVKKYAAHLAHLAHLATPLFDHLYAEK